MPVPVPALYVLDGWMYLGTYPITCIWGPKKKLQLHASFAAVLAHARVGRLRPRRRSNAFLETARPKRERPTVRPTSHRPPWSLQHGRRVYVKGQTSKHNKDRSGRKVEWSRLYSVHATTPRTVAGTLHFPTHLPVVSKGSQTGSSPTRTRRDHANVTIAPSAPVDAGCVLADASNAQQ